MISMRVEMTSQLLLCPVVVHWKVSGEGYAMAMLLVYSLLSSFHPFLWAY